MAQLFFFNCQTKSWPSDSSILTFWPPRPCRPGRKTQNGLSGLPGQPELANFFLTVEKKKLGPIFFLTVKNKLGPTFFSTGKKNGPNFFFQLSTKKLASQEPRGLVWPAGRPPGWARPGWPGLARLAWLAWPGWAGRARLRSPAEHSGQTDRHQNARQYVQNA